MRNKLISKFHHFKDCISRIIYYIPIIWKLNDFDYGYVLELERAQLIRLRNYYIEPNGWEYEGMNRNITELSIAIKLLNIIINEDSGYYKDSQFQHYVNIKNRNRFYKNYLYFKHPISQEDLYIQKCWNLYHQIRKYYMKQWWI